MHLITYFFSTIRRYKVRYAACIIGFSMGLASVFAISAYTGLLDDTVNQFYFIDDNSFMLVSKGTAAIQIIPYESEIPENVTDFLEEQPGIVYTVPMIFKDLRNESRFKYMKPTIVGSDLDLLENTYLDPDNLDEGRFPLAGSNEVIIGSTFIDDNHLLGSNITIQNTNFTIAGILKKTNPLVDQFIFADFNLVQTIFEMEDKCTLIYAITDGITLDTAEKIASIEFSLNQIHPSVNLLDQAELDEAIGFFYELVEILNVILSTFPLFICGMFIIVLMILNVKDQEREFGMLRALGMPIRTIALIIFFQSLFIGIIGYIVSLFIGNLFFGYGFSVLDPYSNFGNIFTYIRDMQGQIPGDTYIKTLFISLSMAIIIAIYPILWTLRKSLVQSFRKEQ